MSRQLLKLGYISNKVLLNINLRDKATLLAQVHSASFWNITIPWTSHDDLTEILQNSTKSVFFVKSLIAFINFCHLTSFSFWYHHFTETSGTNLQINLEAKRMDGSSWKKKSILYFSIYLLQLKSFSPWMACFNWNYNDLNFLTKGKSKLV